MSSATLGADRLFARPEGDRHAANAELVALSRKLERAVAVATPATVAVHAYFGDSQGDGGVGSGVVIDPLGLVVTCAHVIGPARNVKVVSASGETLSATILGMNERADVALLEVKLAPGQQLSAITLRDVVQVPLAIGEWVIAIGHPGGMSFDKRPASSLGRLTAMGVRLPAELGTSLAGGLLQTDAPLISGSSGGPLVDAEGRLVAINNAVSLLDERAFALPYPTLAEIIAPWRSAPTLAAVGYLGAAFAQLSERELAGLGVASAARITAVQPLEAAARAGLASGDIIVAWNGTSLPSVDELGELIRASAPGSHVRVTISRDGAHQVIDVALGGRRP